MLAELFYNDAFQTFFYLTWFIYPFIFVFSLAFGIKNEVQNKTGFNFALLVASFSLLFMFIMLLMCILDY
ncbi:hypothetical protein NMU03_06760 [Allocoprobacillus halotolerans]|uniref:Uncharacterized protein n=1 Tax=Allocoprobacillus halotolerans TaxID=2944914 RepID=A0ABY5I578_9FIRM|nr:hypothetical protein [Allocoprobacillus halotolerans]UTY40476.1 hypothetical protein NMU03_06760 [Allocoprobacillus halotolerans]